jgi:hypothetical protein
MMAKFLNPPLTLSLSKGKPPRTDMVRQAHHERLLSDLNLSKV